MVPKAVADGTNGFDRDGRARGGEFFAQSRDVDVDGAGVAVDLVRPDPFQETITAQDDARVLGEHGEQVEFLGAQRDVGPGDAQRTPVQIQHNIADLES